MKKFYSLMAIIMLSCSLGASSGMAQNVVQVVSSPNGKLSVVNKGKGMVVNYQKRAVMEIPALGFEGTSAASEWAFSKKVKDDYTMLAGKRLHCVNEANEYVATLAPNVKMVLRLYNDGVAFRYEIANLANARLPKEQTTFFVAEGTKRWMQQWTEAYEGFFPLSTTAKVKPVPSFSQTSVSPDGFNNRWGYPMLIEADSQTNKGEKVYALITEANVERKHSASCLYNDGENFRVVPDGNELEIQGNWHSPWRVVIMGTLADVVQSTLVTDLSEPSAIKDTSWIHPGVVSWVYWAYNHGSNDYNIIKKYVDLAVELHLPYVLIDAEWDEMKDGKTVEDAVNYAKSKNIKPMIWYNSSVGWVNGAPGPKYRLNKKEDREKEFAWCERIGVTGVKIDFFSGDNQMNMDYCLDLLEAAARHHLLVNFHGATIPRGWQRTWPNLLSTEGVYGAEWYNNVPTFTDKAASHNATLPFTRNVIGPMDYTPCAFSDSQHPHITSHAHELALTVLYESGLQHLADRPESFLAQPTEVRAFFGQLPVAWDETRLVAGYPGEYVVMARRKGNVWYVAGINGTNEMKTLEVKLDFIKGKGKNILFVDNPSQDKANPWVITNPKRLPSSITCQPRGGFVMVFEKKR